MNSKAKTKKFIPALLIILIIVPVVLFSTPKKAHAIPVSEIGHFGWVNLFLTGGGTAQQTIETGHTITNALLEIARQAVMVVERKLLQQMTKGIVNWINSGFHGSPLFLENPDSFFKDIAKTEIKTLVNEFGYDPNRFPFGEQFALNTINSYKRQSADDAAYSLSKVMTPIQANNYRNNFNAGGWNGFLINTQYPQNNYLGFQMIATDQLARKLQGTTQNAAQKVQTTLQQGMGFLSPQKCPDSLNPDYNNGVNEFQKQTFDPSTIPHDPPSCSAAQTSLNECTAKQVALIGIDCSTQQTALDQCNASVITYEDTWTQQATAAKNAFDKKNSCVKPDGTSGLVATTPGSVAANQIMNALGSPMKQNELSAALGNSLGSILDAFMNHFLQQGLNSMASTINPSAPADNFNYQGNTLGSPVVDTPNTPWDAGPDQPIVLPDFKKTVQSDIDNTTKEIALMDNTDKTNYGITQYLGLIWPQVRELDMCLPGPDMSWQERLSSEESRNSGKLQSWVGGTDTTKENAALEATNDFENAVSLFKDWMTDKMSASLPDAPVYVDAVNGITPLYQEYTELTQNKQTKTDTLTRLQAIQASLSQITTQPASGSSGETDLINLKNKYDAISVNISNATTMGNTQNELNTAKNKYNKLLELVNQCNTEKKASTTFSTGNEQNFFCDAPVVGGFTHKGFINTSGVTVPELPLINASDVLKSASVPGVDTPVDTNMNCSIIYNAGISDYRQTLPTPPATPPSAN